MKFKFISITKSNEGMIDSDIISSAYKIDTEYFIFGCLIFIYKCSMVKFNFTSPYNGGEKPSGKLIYFVNTRVLIP